MKLSQWLTVLGAVIALILWFVLFKVQGIVLLVLITLTIGGIISILKQKSWIFKILGATMFVVGLVLLITYPWLLFRVLFPQ